MMGNEEIQYSEIDYKLQKDLKQKLLNSSESLLKKFQIKQKQRHIKSLKNQNRKKDCDHA